MSSGQHARAECCVVREPVGIKALDRNLGFHIPELADIEVAPTELRPPKERVTGGLHDALSRDHPLSIVWERVLVQMRLEGRRWRLFELEEERIVVASAI